MEPGTTELQEPDYDAALADEETDLMARLEELRQSRRAQRPDGQTELAAATAEPDEADDGVMEFTTNTPKPVFFRLDGIDMYAAGVMPAGFMLDVIENRTSLRNSDRSGQMRIILDMLKSVIFPESWAVVHRRMYDPKDPIEFETIVRMVNWLTGKVYRRPTQRSSVSSGERSQTGTSSTDGAQPTESTPEPSETTPSSST